MKWERKNEQKIKQPLRRKADQILYRMSSISSVTERAELVFHRIRYFFICKNSENRRTATAHKRYKRALGKHKRFYIPRSITLGEHGVLKDIVKALGERCSKQEIRKS